MCFRLARRVEPGKSASASCHTWDKLRDDRKRRPHGFPSDRCIVLSVNPLSPPRLLVRWQEIQRDRGKAHHMCARPPLKRPPQRMERSDAQRDSYHAFPAASGKSRLRRRGRSQWRMPGQCSGAENELREAFEGQVVYYLKQRRFADGAIPGELNRSVWKNPQAKSDRRSGPIGPQPAWRMQAEKRPRMTLNPRCWEACGPLATLQLDGATVQLRPAMTVLATTCDKAGSWRVGDVEAFPTVNALPDTSHQVRINADRNPPCLEQQAKSASTGLNGAFHENLSLELSGALGNETVGPRTGDGHGATLSVKPAWS